MFRRLTRWIVESCLLLGLGLTAALMALATDRNVLSAWGGDQAPRPAEDLRPLLFSASPIPSSAGLAPAAPVAVPEMVPLPMGHVTLILHGVADDGREWAPRFKKALVRSSYDDLEQQVYLFRWTQPDGSAPAVGHARSSLAGLAERVPADPARESLYQIDEARRLKDFLVGARELYREYGVDGRIDVVAHSQGTLLTLEALDEGGEADNVVFMGSPLSYTGERQDDVIGALPHVRGVLYNYYTPSDTAIRYMGGGLLCEPRGWPTKDLPRDKVVQVRLAVAGHTGYYTPESIEANYRDKLGLQPGEEHRLPAEKAAEFARRWDELVQKARLIDPE